MLPVLANPGSALPLLIIGHLIFLNFLIGIVEGVLLAPIARVRFIRAVPIMLLANYASAWIGAILLSVIAYFVNNAWDPDPSLYHARQAFAFLLTFAFLLAIVLELPFVWWASRGQPRPLFPLWNRAAPPARKPLKFARLLAACTFLQAVSYTGLAFYYAPNLELSLLFFHSTRDASKIAAGAQGWVYYLDAPNNHVRRVRLDATGDEPVGPANLDVRTRGLLAANDIEGLPLYENDPAAVVRSSADRAGARIAGSGAFTIADFRDESARDSDTFNLYDYEYPIRLVHTHTDDSGAKARGELSLGWGTTHVQWHALYCTILPSTGVVLQLGPQIVIFDRAQRISVLAKGWAPVVVLDADHADSAANPQPPAPTQPPALTPSPAPTLSPASTQTPASTPSPAATPPR